MTYMMRMILFTNRRADGRTYSTEEDDFDESYSDYDTDTKMF